MKKRLFSLLLAVALVVGMLPVSAWAAEADGGGTTDQPTADIVTKTISSPAEWENFVATVNADNKYNVMLAVDIAVSQPIPTFSGTFNGGNHKITFSEGNLFTTVASGSQITNLTVEGGGKICSSTDGVTVTNCVPAVNAVTTEENPEGGTGGSSSAGDLEDTQPELTAKFKDGNTSKTCFAGEEVKIEVTGIATNGNEFAVYNDTNNLNAIASTSDEKTILTFSTGTALLPANSTAYSLTVKSGDTPIKGNLSLTVKEVTKIEVLEVNSPVECPADGKATVKVTGTAGLKVKAYIDTTEVSAETELGTDATNLEIDLNGKSVTAETHDVTVKYTASLNTDVLNATFKLNVTSASSDTETFEATFKTVGGTAASGKTATCKVGDEVTIEVKGSSPANVSCTVSPSEGITQPTAGTNGTLTIQTTGWKADTYTLTISVGDTPLQETLSLVVDSQTTVPPDENEITATFADGKTQMTCVKGTASVSVKIENATAGANISITSDNSAFTAVNDSVGDNGTATVSISTTNLDVGTYSLKVTIGDKEISLALTISGDTPEAYEKITVDGTTNLSCASNETRKVTVHGTVGKSVQAYTKDNKPVSKPATLSSSTRAVTGSAELTIDPKEASLTAGTHSIIVKYTDSGHDAQNSDAFTLTVTDPAPKPTAVLGAGPYKEYQDITVTVSNVANVQTVQIFDGLSSTEALDTKEPGGSSTVTLTFQLSAGAHTLRVTADSEMITSSLELTVDEVPNQIRGKSEIVASGYEANTGKFYYGVDMQVTVSNLTRDGQTLSSGNVSIYAGNDKLATATVTSNGTASFTAFNTEASNYKDYFRPKEVATGTSVRDVVLNVYYNSTDENKGDLVSGCDMALQVQLMSLPENTAAGYEDLNTSYRITAPDGYTLCEDIYSSNYSWTKSVTIEKGAELRTYTYYLKADTSKAITTKRPGITIPANPGDSNLPNIGDKGRLKITNPVYDGKPHGPIITDTKNSTAEGLREGVHYSIEYYPTSEAARTNARVPVEITITGLAPYYRGTYEDTYEIAPKEIVPEFDKSTSTATKIYDTTTNCSGEGLKIILPEVLEGDDVDVTATFTYDNANVGEKKRITASDLTLIGDSKQNYKLLFLDPDGNETLSAAVGEITPLTLTVNKVTVADKPYDGTKAAEITDVTFNETLPAGVKLVNGTHYTGTAEFAQADVKHAADGGTGVENITVTGTITAKDTNIDITSGDFTAEAKILRTQPTISPWPTSTEIKFGDPLSASALNNGKGWAAGGKEELPGSFTWVTPDKKLDAGTSEQEVKFETTSPNYEAITNKVSVKVNQAELTATKWPEAKPIYYGQKMSETEFEGGEVTPSTKGKWSWATFASGETAPDKAGNYAYSVRFVPDDSNYSSVESGATKVNLEVKPAVPKIKITPGDQSIVKAGTTVTVSTEISNPHDPTLKGDKVPKDPKLTYKIGEDGEETAIRKGQFQIPEDTPEGTPIVIKATTEAIPDYYAAGEATVTLSTTKRKTVAIEAEKYSKKIVYSGGGHNGVGKVTFEDEDGEPITNFKENEDYTYMWADSTGKALEEAPVYPGKYTFRVRVDNPTYAATSDPVEFEIEKRPLQWGDSSLTASKPEGSDKEVPVDGRLTIKNTVSGDKVSMPDELPVLITSGFAEHTAVGDYKDVIAIPEGDRTWNEILPELDYYIWPEENPSVKASVKAETPEKSPGGETLCLDVVESLKDAAAKLQEKHSNMDESYIRTTMNNERGSKFKSGTSKATSKFYDVKLLVEKADGSLEEATLENFPSSGKLTVKMAYPGDSSKESEFEIIHMFVQDADKAGKTEKIEDKDITKGDKELSFTVTGLSPILVSWTKASSSSNNNNSNNNNNNSNNSNNSNNRPSTSDDDDEEEYRVRLYSSTGGKVTANMRYAEEDDTVRLTVTPDSGYRLQSISVTDKRGRTIRTRQSNGKYVFTMPDRDVEVEATFTSIFSPTTYTPSSSSTGTLYPTNTSWSGTTSAVAPSNCSYGSACPSLAFPDLNTQMWYHDSTDYVINSGLMTGLPSGNFAPYSTLSRAMIVQMLYTHAGMPAVSASRQFEDVDEGAWFENAVNWSVEQGIAQGIGNNLFAPNAAVTREQLALMLYNYGVRRGMSMPATQAQITFTDNTRISQWAATAVSTMQRAGVVTGKSGNMFEPKGTATRVEAAQMLWKLFR